MKKIIVLAAVLLLATGGVLVGYPKYKQWKHAHYLAQARQFLAQQDYRNAGLSARKAMDANPRSVEACRIMAEIAEAFRSPLAISWRQRVVEFEPGVAKNQLDLAKSALLQGNYEQADKAIRSVDPGAQNTTAYHQLAAVIAVAGKNIAKADWHFAQAAKLEPDNKLFQLNRAVLRLQATDQRVVAQAQATLEQLYQDPAYRKDALRHLTMAALKDKDFAKAQAFAKELQTDAVTAFDDRLLYLSTLKEGESADFAGYLAQLEESAAKNPDDLYALAAWLLNNQMADESFRWLGTLPAAVQAKPPAAIALADCYAFKRDWPSLQAMLQDKNWGEVEFLRLAHLAHAYREQNQAISAMSEWRAALKASGERLKPLTTLARMATGWGWDKEREELLWLIAQRFPGERWVFESLSDLCTASGNTRGLQKVYATLLVLNPDDVVAKNNFAALSLLLNTQTNKAHQSAREAYGRYPQNAAFASTYAYSLHLLGRTKEGLKLLEGLPPAKLEEPSIAVYYGVMLAATDQLEKAKKYVALAEGGRLLPEERALLAAAKGER